VTILESLKNRASLILSGAISFLFVIRGMRPAGGEPIIQPRADVGIVLGLALAALILVLNDLRAGRAQ